MTANKRAARGDEKEKYPRKAIHCPPGVDDRETARNLAILVTSPELAAYRVVNAAEQKSGWNQHIDAPLLAAQLRDQSAEVKGGNFARVESMLMSQATALQSLFARLAERGMGCAEVVPFEANMRMALRAQSQCRATLETLAVIKNPPVVFAKQANIAHGPQQVNNGGSPLAQPARAGKFESEPNKLLEVHDGERVDTSTTSAPSRTDKALEALGEVDRTQDG